MRGAAAMLTVAGRALGIHSHHPVIRDLLSSISRPALDSVCGRPRACLVPHGAEPIRAAAGGTGDQTRNVGVLQRLAEAAT